MTQTTPPTSTAQPSAPRQSGFALRAPRPIRAALDAAVTRWNAWLTEYEIDLKHMQEIVT